MCCERSPDSPAPPELHGASAAAGGAVAGPSAAEDLGTAAGLGAGAIPAGVCLAVFDLDGTITRFDTLLPFVLRCLARRPWRWPRLLRVLPTAMGFLLTWDRAALKGALIHGTLGGLSRAEVQQEAQGYVGSVLRRGLYRQAVQAVQAHRARGEYLLLMSASPDLYVPQLAAALGFDQCLCTRVRWRADGRLDGRLASANCRGSEKQRLLAAWIERSRPARVYAYGNSRADLAHLQLAQEAYLVNSAARLPATSRVQRLHWRG